MNRRILPAIGFVVLGALLWSPQAGAQIVHYVDNVETCNGLGPCYTTIMDAVNAAAPSDSISVFPGVYREEVVIASKDGLVLRAHTPALKPVLTTPPGGEFGVTIRSMNVQVLNFVIEGEVFGSGASGGAVIQGNYVIGSIVLRSSSWTVRDNVVVGEGSRPGIFAWLGGSNSLIQGNTLIGGSIRTEESIQITIRNNVVYGGGLALGGRYTSQSTVELNVVIGGDISGAGPHGFDNVIRSNVIRGGGLRLTFYAAGNNLTSNFVSGSPADGIAVDGYNPSSANQIQNNTAVENVGCDINDTTQYNPDATVVNIWTENRFVTKCGTATD